MIGGGSAQVHLAHIAYNSLFLGEIGHMDWDMFTTTHDDAYLHAAARAVGGSQIYVSDKPGEHDFDLLRQLVLPDGTTLLAQHAGRPTRDTLFSDVNADGVSALKVWNRNALTGLVGIFNAQGARWDRKTRAFVEHQTQLPIEARVKGIDVEGLFAADVAAAPAAAGATVVGGQEVVLYTYRGQQVQVAQASAQLHVHVGGLSFDYGVTPDDGQKPFARYGRVTAVAVDRKATTARIRFERPHQAAAAQHRLDRKQLTGMSGAYLRVEFPPVPPAPL